jgi:RpiB/LacA/LacB family sugar-phosphate isomerase
MKVALAADHAGFEMKQGLLSFLREQGHEVVDLGTNDSSPVDYPDFAVKLGKAVVDGAVRRGILLCGSGVGASVAANKLRGIRAGLCHDTYSAHQGVEHDDINILVLGARVIGSSLAMEIVSAFLRAEFSRDERHVRRLAKVALLEK